MQKVACALILALLKAGSSIAARMAMIAITTKSSMSVKARLREMEASFVMVYNCSGKIGFAGGNRALCRTQLQNYVPRKGDHGGAKAIYQRVHKPIVSDLLA